MSRAALNSYNNAAAIYANPNWKYYAPYMGSVAVLFNAKKMPFFIKNGRRQSFTRRTNSNGVNRLYFGPGNDNYLMNAPPNSKNVYSHFAKYKSAYGLTKRNPLLNTGVAYSMRSVKRRYQSRKNAAQNKRVNKLANNVRRGANISRAKTTNLLALVMRYQNPNAGAYYERQNNGRVVNINGKKPTRKQLLQNIENFKMYNMF